MQPKTNRHPHECGDLEPHGNSIPLTLDPRTEAGVTDHIWLPYSQMKTALPPLKVARTEGCRIILEDGRELIDGIASWWTACHGYNHPYIRTSVQKQLEIMPHVMFGGLVHEPATTLSRRLCELTKMSRVFFADSGSIAVEIALKMALQYWQNLSKPEKTKFICFTNGYHGDTMGAMSVSDPAQSMHKAFKSVVPKHYVVDVGDFAALESALKNKDVAGVILEPLVQGAEGMKFHSAETLAEIYRLTKKHGALFIADEIATGFGRTGTMFACEQAAITPDIMCVGKALTGGTMTLAATLASQEIFNAFLSDDPDKAFMHGPTYMANPLACAAANASLDLFSSPLGGEQLRTSAQHEVRSVGGNSGTTPPTPSLRPKASLCDSPPRGEWYQRITAIEAQLREELESCRKLPNVIDVRVKGAIGVVQMEKMDIQAMRQKFIERGVWIRPIKDVIYLMPAFTITSQELRILTKEIFISLNKK
jgi:adenosylmethionine-8-amino-7-oxononanoate aminotransferase